MTTITWDLNILSADTLVSDSTVSQWINAANYTNWKRETKLFTSLELLKFESSPIIAIGAAGDASGGDQIVNYLLKKDEENNPSPANPSMSDLIAKAQSTVDKYKRSVWLLILTKDKCWRVDAKYKKPVVVTDVTDIPTAIGAGAPHARPCLAAGKDGIASIIEASRRPESVTNSRIEYVEHKPGATIKRAWRSYVTLRDPVRLNNMIFRLLAVVGAALAGAGAFALQVGGDTGTPKLVWTAACLAGLVTAGSSILFSFRRPRGLYYQLGATLLMAVAMALPPSSPVIKEGNLKTLILLYFAGVGVLYVVRQLSNSWLLSYETTLPLNAVHTVAGLTTAGLLGAVFVVRHAPYDLGLLTAGLVGAGVGYAGAYLTLEYTVVNYGKHRALFDR